METIRGFVCKGEALEHWAPLVEEWSLAIERYCRMVGGGDAPFNFRERANIGLLSGAAWRCGRIALEEFRHEKKSKKGRERSGRADLWLSSEEDEELIEAKFKWVSLRSKDFVGIANTELGKAKKDADDTRNDDDEITAIGVSFLATYLKEGHIDSIEGLIRESIKHMQEVDADLIAWCFPKEERNEVYGNGNILPGIFMLAKAI